MKYIRTKNGKIYEIETKEFYGHRKGYFKNVDNNFNLYNSLSEWQLDCKNQYCVNTPNGYTTCVKQANTIEELCDYCFVFRKSSPNPIITNFYGAEPYIECFVKKTNSNNPVIDIKGAILTDKGLIYVAKMNEEGVLCLI